MQPIDTLNQSLQEVEQAHQTYYLKIEGEGKDEHVVVIKRSLWNAWSWLKAAVSTFFGDASYDLAKIAAVFKREVEESKNMPQDSVKKISEVLEKSPLLYNSDQHAVSKVFQGIFMSSSPLLEQLHSIDQVVWLQKEKNAFKEATQAGTDDAIRIEKVIDTVIRQVDAFFISLNQLKQKSDQVPGSLFQGAFEKVYYTLAKLLDDLKTAPKNNAEVQEWSKTLKLLSQFLVEAKYLLNANDIQTPGQLMASAVETRAQKTNKAETSRKEAQGPLLLMELRSLLRKAELVAQEKGVPFSSDSLWRQMGKFEDQKNHAFTEQELQGSTKKQLMQLRDDLYSSLEPLAKDWGDSITTKNGLVIGPLSTLKNELNAN